MKTRIYTLLSVILITQMAVPANGQTWRGKLNGLPTGFSAKTVYGEGTNILISNSSAFSGHQMYYTPDSSTLFNFSASTLGSFATIESHIVKCQNVLFVGSTGGIYKSHDNGQTWTAVPSATGTYAVYACNDTLYATIGASDVKISVDTGNTWTSMRYPGSLAVAYFKTGGTLYVGGTSSMYYTADNGATWINVTTPSSILGAAVADIAALGGSVYAGTNNGIYKTSDNGTTWARVLAQSIFSMTSVDTTLLAGTNGNGVYMSDQTGTIWNQVNTGLPHVGGSFNSVNSITWNDDFVICSAGGDSSVYVIGLAELGLSPNPGALNNPVVSKQEMNITLFPNPAKNEVALQLKNRTLSNVSVTMYDITGRNIKSAVYNNTTYISWDLNGISAGVYCLYISSGTDLAVKKLLVQK